ncbi:hypothetical protein ABSA28_00297 [Candidatus Hepatincolaceae symbiont of Richtersius coronifer]
MVFSSLIFAKSNLLWTKKNFLSFSLAIILLLAICVPIKWISEPLIATTPPKALKKSADKNLILSVALGRSFPQFSIQDDKIYFGNSISNRLNSDNSFSKPDSAFKNNMISLQINPLWQFSSFIPKLFLRVDYQDNFQNYFNNQNFSLNLIYNIIDYDALTLYVGVSILNRYTNAIL